MSERSIHPTDRLPVQLAAISWLGSGVKLRRALIGDGAIVFDEAWGRLDADGRQSFVSAAEALFESNVSLLSILDDEYPDTLRELSSPPPILFAHGNLALLNAPGIGMCGSRNVSDRGLHAAAVCAQRAARQDLSVISGYARGVDMAGHVEVLRSGGATVIVLAEGIDRFRLKQGLRDVFDWSRVLVLSQFAPKAAWSPGNAMSRNGIIAALGRVLVVVDAGLTGGTIDAGRQGLATGRRVIAIDYSNETPSGSRQLIAEGAVAIGTPADLDSYLSQPADAGELRGSGQSTFF
ncbi:MAG: DNA-processing protein DprA [Solirubrobacterales bacterium]|nr:DNA-processing protein DprA [Solirubrobacterales bacterium]